MKREDLLAYLIVLNYQPVIDQLSEADYKIGRAHMMGCLDRVIRQLEVCCNDSSVLNLAELVKAREKENGSLKDSERLRHLTSLCAIEIHQLISLGDFFEKEIEGNS